LKYQDFLKHQLNSKNDSLFLITANATYKLRTKTRSYGEVVHELKCTFITIPKYNYWDEEGTSSTNSECTSKFAGILLSGLLEVSLSNIYRFRSVH
jgi:hypothetical protein